MIESLISALGFGLDLTSREIADVVWLALQMQESDRLPNSESNASITTTPQPQELIQPQSSSGLFSPPAATKSRELSQEEPAAGLYNSDQNGVGGMAGALSLRVPDARSLREPLSLARALKPLLSLVAAGQSRTLDEAATVEQIIEQQVWLPVLKPSLEPALELALVVDESVSMQIWQRTIADLQRFLTHYGVFRDVRIWGLLTDERGRVRVRPGIGKAGRRQSLRQASELIDPSGRRLILVVTDCVGNLWRDGMIQPVLKLWAASGPMAIVQMLPEWLWSRTRLGFASPVRLRAALPGIPNQQLEVRDLSPWDEVDLVAGVKVPVVTLEPEPFGAWAQMMMGKGNAWTAGVVLEPEVTGQSEINLFQTAELSAEERVQQFRVTASPIARRLASLLAAAPVISLPVVRIIQERLLAESRQVHVAEVFLGGLLKPLVEILPETNVDRVPYEFLDGVRDLLMESVATSTSINVLNEVSQFMAERLGLSMDSFTAMLRNLQDVENQDLVGEVRPFAIVTAQILNKLGGGYAQFAKELETFNQIDFQADTKLSESLFTYHVGGSVPYYASSYVVRYADKELYERLKIGTSCCIFSPRQMGKSSLAIRAIMRLQAEGILCVHIDLCSIGSHDLDSEKFYSGFTYELMRQLNLDIPIKFEVWWKDKNFLSPNQRLNEFIENFISDKISNGVIIFLDEVDYILDLDFSGTFFNWIRAFHEKKSSSTKCTHLTFALFGVANPSNLIKARESPVLNIAYSIKLEGFQELEALVLAEGLKANARDPQAVLREVLYWTSGQPFLTQKLCDLILRLPISISKGNEKQAIENLVMEQIIEDWEAQDELTHLVTIRDFLVHGPNNKKILSIYKEILRKSEIAINHSPEQIKLQLSGLVVSRSGRLQIFNRIYESIFNQSWIDEKLSEFKPYIEAFNNWVASNYQDNSYLLRGPNLRESLVWSQGKNLSKQDYTFLDTSKSEFLKTFKTRDNFRIYELSKELDLENRDLLVICDQLKIAVKSHSSKITDVEAEMIISASFSYHSPVAKSSLVSPVGQKKQQILQIRRPTVDDDSSSPTSLEKPQVQSTPPPILKSHQNNSIYVGNLLFQVTEEDLRRVFSEYGEVVRITLPIDRETGKKRGFSFVEMATEAQANLAIEELHEAEWMGREMIVNRAKPRGAVSF